MGFQLTISTGKEAGRDFAFEQPQVVIGRSSECDVVLYEVGVSRRHARIFAEDEHFFVEDLGSANGTKVNGQAVKKRKLVDGDAIGLGPVVFKFVGTELTDPQMAEPQVADQHTRIVSVPARPARPKSGRGEALAPEGAHPEQLRELTRKKTTNMAAVTRPRNSNPQVDARAAPARPALGGLSAAERARIRRQSSGPAAQLKIFWLEATPKVKALITAGLASLGLLFFGLLYWAVLAERDDGVDLPPEPAELTRKPIDHAFGWGEGVHYKRPDMKVFEFVLVSSVRAIAIIHYQAKDISEGEVVITANGRELGTVPADTLNSQDRALEVVIPATVLKRGEKNQIIFDNVKNPPEKDPWRIWNVWVEPVMLRELPPEELLREAKVAFDRAILSFDRREVGAGNRYEAWNEFRTAWITLEAYPDPKPELYLLAREKMRETQRELDQLCSKLMLEVERYYNQRDWDRARGSLEHVKSYFPNRDQLCPLKAARKRVEYGL
jgi:pSer/pThr/pTyr-binding forkhead associated (FHA) protein